MRFLSAALLLILIGFLTLISNQAISGLNSSDLIYSKDSQPFGISYSEWVGKWWQWQVSIPNKADEADPSNLTLTHPREAYSPEKCSWNQNDPNVWFLPDGRNLASETESPEIRNCTVPQGKAIIVQIYGGGCSFGEGLKTDQALKDCVDIGLDKVTFTARVDGTEVMNSNNRYDFLPQAHLYNLTYVEDNYYRVTAGNYRAMAGGYFLFVKPLPSGEHILEFKETFYKPGFEGQYSPENRISNVLYHLKVD